MIGIIVKKLKYLIFGLRNLVIEADQDSSKGKIDWSSPSIQEFGRLIQYARTQEIEPVVFANHSWDFGQGRTAEAVLGNQWGKMQWLTAKKLGWPLKPQAAAMEAVLKHLKCAPNEVLYVGNTEKDMQTAVNGGVLFLNATWISDSIPYGFKFKTPKAIAKFIDVFCVRSHGWHFSVEEGGLHYYSLAPFSTMKPEYETYSEDARDTAKSGIGTPTFWGRYLCATMFLTGLYQQIDYMCPFPSHAAKKWNDPLMESLNTFAQCFRIKYISNLIVRHTTSMKAQKNPALMDHWKHLDTIHLTQKPIKSVKSGTTYAKSPLKSGKTVLVVDDICTQGFSLEAARTYIERTGASVITVSWLKTINRPFQQLHTGGFKFDPYAVTDWSKAKLTIEAHPYRSTMSDDEAYQELHEKYVAYKNWDWPKGI